MKFWSDIFGPQWQHSDMWIRWHEIKALKDQALLAKIARTDPSGLVRVWTAKRLNDKGLAQVIFAEIACEHSLEVQARAEATMALADQGLLAKIGNTDPSEFVRKAAWKRSDEVLLEDAADQAGRHAAHDAQHRGTAYCPRDRGPRVDPGERQVQAGGQDRRSGGGGISGFGTATDCRRQQIPIGRPPAIEEVVGRGRLTRRPRAAAPCKNRRNRFRRVGELRLEARVGIEPTPLPPGKEVVADGSVSEGRGEQAGAMRATLCYTSQARPTGSNDCTQMILYRQYEGSFRCAGSTGAL